MKVLISDLDGTLYPKKSVTNPNQLEDNIKAVKEWIAQGNLFVVATARGAHHYPVITEKLGFQPNFIGSNGAVLIYESGEIIRKTLPMKVFIDLCEYVKNEQINAGVATGLHDEWIWPSKDCYPIKDAQTYLPSWDDIKIVDPQALDPDEQTDRIQIYVPANNRDWLKEKIIAMGYPITVTTSDDDLVDIGPANSSKGITILEICEKFQIDQDDLIVAGDSENDVPMFALAKRSYCIDHAEDTVKAQADRIVSSLAEAIATELNEM